MNGIISRIFTLLILVFLLTVACGPTRYYHLVVREGDTIEKVSRRMNLNVDKAREFASFNEKQIDENLPGGYRLRVPEDILSDEWRKVFIDYGLARAYSSKGEFARAEMLFRDIMMGGRLIPEMEYELALVLLNQKKTDEAIKYIVRLKEIFPEDDDIYYTLGLSYYDRGLLIRAREILKEGLAYDGVGKVHYGLAMVEMDMEEYEDAHQHILRALELLGEGHPLYERAREYEEIIKVELVRRAQ